MFVTIQPEVVRPRFLVVAACALLVVAVAGCSGKSSRKAPGPDETEAKGTPCQTTCCCRVEDGYYRRHDCASEQACAAAGGECLPADTARCRH
jgi:hypothetical protein